MLKMWGSNGEWNVYQEFFDFSPGTQIDVSAMVYQATDDHIGEESSFYIFNKYFDCGWKFQWSQAGKSDPRKSSTKEFLEHTTVR